jgi:hypothetical protein
MPADDALRVNRRSAVQRLLLAGPVLGAPAVLAAAPARLQLGLAMPPGSSSHALAQSWARRLAQASVQPLPPDTDPAAWCLAEPGAPRAVLALVWAGSATQSLPPGLVSLGALAASPLALLASRAVPSTWPGVRSAPELAAWRCGVDASSSASASAAQHLLQALGLAALQQVPFRGPALLLPALAGARLEFAVQAIGNTEDRVAGNQVSAVDAHRQGEVQMLALASTARLPMLPGVPTVDELLGRRGNDIGRCLLLLAPADLDQRWVRSLQAALNITSP